MGEYYAAYQSGGELLGVGITSADALQDAALVPFDVGLSLRVGCPAACGGGGHFLARLEPFLGELLSPSTCIPPYAAQRLCFNVLLSPNAKVVPAREHPDPLQPSRRAMVLVSV